MRSATPLSVHLFRVFAGFALLCSQLAAASSRAALVIGNDDYADSNLSSLTQARSDARAMAQTLGGLGFDVTTVIDADRDTMLRAILGFEQKLMSSSGEVAMIYYAGHGAANGSEPWLLPVNARIENPIDFEPRAIPMTRLREALERGRWRAGVIVLDACRNELFAGGRQPAGLSRSSFTRGLGRVEASTGILIAYATAAGQVANEQPGASNSEYTSVLLQKLREPGLDLYQIFNGTALEVARRMGSQQKPELMMTALEPVYLLDAGAKVFPGPAVSVPVSPPDFPGEGGSGGWLWVVLGLFLSGSAGLLLWWRTRAQPALSSTGATQVLNIPWTPPVAVIELRDGSTGKSLRRLKAGESVIIGREAPSDVLIPRAELSKRHAEFSFDGRTVWVKDLASTNGVWLGPNSRLPQNQNHIVSPGSTVYLADQKSPIAIESSD